MPHVSKYPLTFTRKKQPHVRYVDRKIDQAGQRERVLQKASNLSPRRRSPHEPSEVQLSNFLSQDEQMQTGWTRENPHILSYSLYRPKK